MGSEDAISLNELHLDGSRRSSLTAQSAHRHGSTSQASIHTTGSEHEGILGLYDAGDSSVLGDWLNGSTSEIVRSNPVRKRRSMSPIAAPRPQNPRNSAHTDRRLVSLSLSIPVPDDASQMSGHDAGSSQSPVSSRTSLSPAHHNSQRGQSPVPVQAAPLSGNSEQPQNPVHLTLSIPRRRSPSPTRAPRAAQEADHGASTGVSGIFLNLPPLEPSGRRGSFSYSDLPEDLQPSSPGGSRLVDVDGADRSANWRPDSYFSEFRAPQPRGRTMFYFSADSRFRNALFHILRNEWYIWGFTVLTLLQTIFLTVEMSYGKSDTGNARDYFHFWINSAYFVMYLCYTLHALAYVIAFGGFTVRVLIYADIKHFLQVGYQKGAKALFGSSGRRNKLDDVDMHDDMENVEQVLGYERKEEMEELLHFEAPFLRKSWNRVELVALICYWVSVGPIASAERSLVLHMFGGLAHIRLLRLLDAVSNTRVILHSLKIAFPLLREVFLFIGLFTMGFAIAGLQSFSSSLSRRCIWIDPTDPTNRWVSDQICGSFYNSEGQLSSYLNEAGAMVNLPPKGYTCPVNSICQVQESLYDGTVNFDDIFNAIEIVFVVMSMNTYSDIMYNIIDAEQKVSCLFFIMGVVVLNYWMLSLLVSVLASSFDVAWESRPPPHPSKWFSWFKFRIKLSSNLVQRLSGRLAGRVYLAVYPIFALLVVVDIVVQAIWSPMDLDSDVSALVLYWEIAVSSILLLEIVWRFYLYWPAWVAFFESSLNDMDLVLAIINVAFLPCYYGYPDLYNWMTFFQLLRVYRFVALFPVAERMFKAVFRNFDRIWNLSCFYFGLTFLASLIACKMFVGYVPYIDPETDEIAYVSFFDLGNSFVAMYQISSTENWTGPVYYVIQYAENVMARAFSAIFFCLWFFFSNFIVLNLFIAVMSSSFEVSRANKRQEQVRKFIEEHVHGIQVRTTDDDIPSTFMAIRKGLMKYMSNKLFTGKTQKHNLKTRPIDAIGLVAEKEILAEFLKYSETNEGTDVVGPTLYSQFAATPFIKTLRKFFDRVLRMLERYPDQHSQQRLNRMHTRSYSQSNLLNRRATEDHHPPYSSQYDLDQDDFTITPRPTLVAIVETPNPGKKALTVPEDPDLPALSRTLTEASDVPLTRRNQTEDFVNYLIDTKTQTESTILARSQTDKHFDRTLWLFPPDNKFRKFLQKIVPSPKGKRASGVTPNLWVSRIFSVFLMLCAIAVVITSCINTPLYHLSITVGKGHSSNQWTWISYSDSVFCCIFFFEFLIKIVADGFHFTPNAYTRSAWNVIDLVVLVSMYVTVLDNFARGPISRYSRAIMSLRALRLITITSQAERVFGAVFFTGLKSILVATFLGLSVVIPSSVWGLNIFHDRLRTCNDTDISRRSNCVAEYLNAPFNWELWSPRVWANSYFNYDSFGQAFFIQFSVLSLEGWIDVLNAVQAVIGPDVSLSTFIYRVNAIFPILYNFVGTVLIMTLFLATIIHNYALSKSTAYLTPEQLTWYYLKKSLVVVRPKVKLPEYKPDTVRYVLLRSMVTPRSLFNLIEMVVLIALTIVLLIYHYPLSAYSNQAILYVISVCGLVYFALSVLKLIILRWRPFIKDLWNIFTLVTTFFLAVFTLAITGRVSSAVQNVQRAALLASVCLWIPKLPAVRRLLHAGMASFGDVLTIVKTYLILFLTFAIAFNQTFGLTKIGETGSGRQNFRTVPNALILLFKMSTGEGWNQVLHDYTLSSPYCEAGDRFLESDCGSKPAAYLLFIAWNVLSMFIFANLFISVIYDTFWYIYRRTPMKVTSHDLDLFQDNWQRYDPESRGYILKKDLYNFLWTSSGYFSMGIYSDDPDYNIRTILERSGARKSYLNRYEVDYEAINRYLENMPVEHFKNKRRLFELFCTHALNSKGDINGKIKFQNFLRQFPLYKDMDPSKALELTEYLDLKVVLYEMRLIMATNFIIRRWKYVKSQRHST